jgi:hypothetical protein
MFQASTTLFEKKFLLVSNLAACGLKFKGSAALLVVTVLTQSNVVLVVSRMHLISARVRCMHPTHPIELKKDKLENVLLPKI